MAEPALELAGLEVRYGSVAAVRGLSLRVDEGEIVGLIGPNGAGKSTTLNAIMGAIPSHAGEIRLKGQSIRKRSPESIARRGIALVPEGRRIFAEFTVEENLRLGLASRRGNGGDPLRRAYDLFPVLEEFRGRHAGLLSGGQQQQLAIGRALTVRPKLLVLDEHDAGMLLIDHNMALVMGVCDRIHVLDQGRTLAAGTPREIRANIDVAAAYLGESAVA